MDDPIVLTLGKDIASIIYRCLFQLQIADVNRQYRKHLRPDTRTDTTCFLAVTGGQYTFNRVPGPYFWISNYTYADKGWKGMYTGANVPRNY